MIRIVRAKLHGIRVTGADLDYHGSITLDPEQCDLAGIYPLEFVEIWNKSSGARISTYVIFGEPGSRCCVLNGAAARTCQKGDEVIIAASCSIEPPQLHTIKPKVLTYRDDNVVDRVLMYDVHRSPAREYDFRTLDITDGVEGAPALTVPIKASDLARG
ncbi:MAG: hypothetical protein RLY86_2006 [Pseudomonadota bacterium]|jgi:aspartate 1-decarboxylase